MMHCASEMEGIGRTERPVIGTEPGGKLVNVVGKWKPVGTLQDSTKPRE